MPCLFGTLSQRLLTWHKMYRDKFERSIIERVIDAVQDPDLPFLKELKEPWINKLQAAHAASFCQHAGRITPGVQHLAVTRKQCYPEPVVEQQSKGASPASQLPSPAAGVFANSSAVINRASAAPPLPSPAAGVSASSSAVINRASAAPQLRSPAAAVSASSSAVFNGANPAPQQLPSAVAGVSTDGRAASRQQCTPQPSRPLPPRPARPGRGMKREHLMDANGRPKSVVRVPKRASDGEDERRLGAGLGMGPSSRFLRPGVPPRKRHDPGPHSVPALCQGQVDGADDSGDEPFSPTTTAQGLQMLSNGSSETPPMSHASACGPDPAAADRVGRSGCGQAGNAPPSLSTSPPWLPSPALPTAATSSTATSSNVTAPAPSGMAASSAAPSVPERQQENLMEVLEVLEDAGACVDELPGDKADSCAEWRPEDVARAQEAKQEFCDWQLAGCPREEEGEEGGTYISEADYFEGLSTDVCLGHWLRVERMNKGDRIRFELSRCCLILPGSDYFVRQCTGNLLWNIPSEASHRPGAASQGV